MARPPRPFRLDDPERVARKARRTRMIRQVALALFLVAATAMAGVVLRNEWRKDAAYRALMRQELLRLLEAEEHFFAANLRWGTREELGRSFVPAQGVTVRVTIDGAGWAWGVATYRDAGDVCVIQFDTVPAAPTCR